jgi:hypothetical protein
MTSDSESLVNRSEERRIIITNKKNEDLKKEYLMRRIIIWKRHNLKDSDLWKQFRERIWWLRRDEIRYCRLERIKEISCFSLYSWRMNHEKTWLFDRQNTVRNLEKRHRNILNQRRICQQFRKIQFRRHWLFTRNEFRSQSHKLFMTNKITIKIT